jgi:hypothetical protein
MSFNWSECAMGGLNVIKDQLRCFCVDAEEMICILFSKTFK